MTFTFVIPASPCLPDRQAAGRLGLMTRGSKACKFSKFWIPRPGRGMTVAEYL